MRVCRGSAYKMIPPIHPSLEDKMQEGRERANIDEGVDRVHTFPSVINSGLQASHSTLHDGESFLAFATLDSVVICSHQTSRQFLCPVPGAPVTCVRWAPASAVLAVAVDGHVHIYARTSLWRWTVHAILNLPLTHSSVIAIDWAGDAAVLALGTEGGALLIHHHLWSEAPALCPSAPLPANCDSNARPTVTTVSLTSPFVLPFISPTLPSPSRKSVATWQGAGPTSGACPSRGPHPSVFNPGTFGGPRHMPSSSSRVESRGLYGGASRRALRGSLIGSLPPGAADAHDDAVAEAQDRGHAVSLVAFSIYGAFVSTVVRGARDAVIWRRSIDTATPADAARGTPAVGAATGGPAGSALAAGAVAMSPEPPRFADGADDDEAWVRGAVRPVTLHHPAAVTGAQWCPPSLPRGSLRAAEALLTTCGDGVVRIFVESSLPESVHFTLAVAIRDFACSPPLKAPSAAGPQTPSPRRGVADVGDDPAQCPGDGAISALLPKDGMNSFVRASWVAAAGAAEMAAACLPARQRWWVHPPGAAHEAASATRDARDDEAATAAAAAATSDDSGTISRFFRHHDHSAMGAVRDLGNLAPPPLATTRSMDTDLMRVAVVGPDGTVRVYAVSHLAGSTRRTVSAHPLACLPVAVPPFAIGIDAHASHPGGRDSSLFHADVVPAAHAQAAFHEMVAGSVRVLVHAGHTLSSFRVLLHDKNPCVSVDALLSGPPAPDAVVTHPRTPLVLTASPSALYALPPQFFPEAATSSISARVPGAVAPYAGLVSVAESSSRKHIWAVGAPARRRGAAAAAAEASVVRGHAGVLGLWSASVLDSAASGRASHHVLAPLLFSYMTPHPPSFFAPPPRVPRTYEFAHDESRTPMHPIAWSPLPLPVGVLPRAIVSAAGALWLVAFSLTCMETEVGAFPPGSSTGSIVPSADACCNIASPSGSTVFSDGMSTSAFGPSAAGTANGSFEVRGHRTAPDHQTSNGLPAARPTPMPPISPAMYSVRRQLQLPRSAGLGPLLFLVTVPLPRGVNWGGPPVALAPPCPRRTAQPADHTARDTDAARDVYLVVAASALRNLLVVWACDDSYAEVVHYGPLVDDAQASAARAAIVTATVASHAVAAAAAKATMSQHGHAHRPAQTPAAFRGTTEDASAGPLRLLASSCAPCPWPLPAPEAFADPHALDDSPVWAQATTGRGDASTTGPRGSRSRSGSRYGAGLAAPPAGPLTLRAALTPAVSAVIGVDAAAAVAKLAPNGVPAALAAAAMSTTFVGTVITTAIAVDGVDAAAILRTPLILALPAPSHHHNHNHRTASRRQASSSNSQLHVASVRGLPTASPVPAPPLARLSSGGPYPLPRPNAPPLSASSLVASGTTSPTTGAAAPPLAVQRGVAATAVAPSPPSHPLPTLPRRSRGSTSRASDSDSVISMLTSDDDDCGSADDEAAAARPPTHPPQELIIPKGVHGILCARAALPAVPIAGALVAHMLATVRTGAQLVATSPTIRHTVLAAGTRVLVFDRCRLANVVDVADVCGGGARATQLASPTGACPSAAPRDMVVHVSVSGAVGEPITERPGVPMTLLACMASGVVHALSSVPPWQAGDRYFSRPPRTLRIGHPTGVAGPDAWWRVAVFNASRLTQRSTVDFHEGDDPHGCVTATGTLTSTHHSPNALGGGGGFSLMSPMATLSPLSAAFSLGTVARTGRVVAATVPYSYYAMDSPQIMAVAAVSGSSGALCAFRLSLAGVPSAAMPSYHPAVVFDTMNNGHMPSALNAFRALLVGAVDAFDPKQRRWRPAAAWLHDAAAEAGCPPLMGRPPSRPISLLPTVMPPPLLPSDVEVEALTEPIPIAEFSNEARAKKVLAELDELRLLLGDRAFQLPGLSENQHARLAALAQCLAATATRQGALDAGSLRFYHFVVVLRLTSLTGMDTHLRTDERISDTATGASGKSHTVRMFRSVAMTAWVWASFSDSQDACWDTCFSDVRPVFAEAALIGAPFWLKASKLRTVAETVAKAEYQATKDPVNAALFLIAAARQSTLVQMFKSAYKERESAFWARDFSQERHAIAAEKNAYNCLSSQKHEYAAAFFLAAGSFQKAVETLLKKCTDHHDALAVLIYRLHSPACAPYLAGATTQLGASSPDFKKQFAAVESMIAHRLKARLGKSPFASAVFHLIHSRTVEAIEVLAEASIGVNLAAVPRIEAPQQSVASSMAGGAAASPSADPMALGGGGGGGGDLFAAFMSPTAAPEEETAVAADDEEAVCDVIVEDDRPPKSAWTDSTLLALVDWITRVNPQAKKAVEKQLRRARLRLTMQTAEYLCKTGLPLAAARHLQGTMTSLLRRDADLAEAAAETPAKARKEKAKAAEQAKAVDSGALDMSALAAFGFGGMGPDDDNDDAATASCGSEDDDDAVPAVADDECDDPAVPSWWVRATVTDLAHTVTYGLLDDRLCALRGVAIRSLHLGSSVHAAGDHGEADADDEFHIDRILSPMGAAPTAPWRLTANGSTRPVTMGGSLIPDDPAPDAAGDESDDDDSTSSPRVAGAAPVAAAEASDDIDAAAVTRRGPYADRETAAEVGHAKRCGVPAWVEAPPDGLADPTVALQYAEALAHDFRMVVQLVTRGVVESADQSGANDGAWISAPAVHDALYTMCWRHGFTLSVTLLHRVGCLLNGFVPPSDPIVPVPPSVPVRPRFTLTCPAPPLPPLFDPRSASDPVDFLRAFRAVTAPLPAPPLSIPPPTPGARGASRRRLPTLGELMARAAAGWSASPASPVDGMHSAACAVLRHLGLLDLLTDSIADGGADGLFALWRSHCARVHAVRVFAQLADLLVSQRALHAWGDQPSPASRRVTTVASCAALFTVAALTGNSAAAAGAVAASVGFASSVVGARAATATGVLDAGGVGDVLPSTLRVVATALQQKQAAERGLATMWGIAKERGADNDGDKGGIGAWLFGQALADHKRAASTRARQASLGVANLWLRATLVALTSIARTTLLAVPEETLAKITAAASSRCSHDHTLGVLGHAAKGEEEDSEAVVEAVLKVVAQPDDATAVGAVCLALSRRLVAAVARADLSAKVADQDARDREQAATTAVGAGTTLSSLMATAKEDPFEAVLRAARGALHGTASPSAIARTLCSQLASEYITEALPGGAAQVGHRLLATAASPPPSRTFASLALSLPLTMQLFASHTGSLPARLAAARTLLLLAAESKAAVARVEQIFSRSVAPPPGTPSSVLALWRYALPPWRREGAAEKLSMITHNSAAVALEAVLSSLGAQRAIASLADGAWSSVLSAAAGGLSSTWVVDVAAQPPYEIYKDPQCLVHFVGVSSGSGEGGDRLLMLGIGSRHSVIGAERSSSAIRCIPWAATLTYRQRAKDGRTLLDEEAQTFHAALHRFDSAMQSARGSAQGAHVPPARPQLIAPIEPPSPPRPSAVPVQRFSALLASPSVVGMMHTGVVTESVDATGTTFEEDDELDTFVDTFDPLAPTTQVDVPGAAPPAGQTGAVAAVAVPPSTNAADAPSRAAAQRRLLKTFAKFGKSAERFADRTMDRVNAAVYHHGPKDPAKRRTKGGKGGESSGDDHDVNELRALTHFDCHPSLPLVLAGDDKGHIHVLRFDSQTVVRSYNASSHTITAVRFAPDGFRFVAGDSRGTLFFFRFDGLSDSVYPFLVIPNAMLGPVADVCFTARETTVIAVGVTPEHALNLRIFDLLMPDRLWRVYEAPALAKDSEPSCILYSSRFACAVIGTRSGEVILFSVAQLQIVGRAIGGLDGRSVRCMALSEDERQLVTGSSGGDLHVFSFPHLQQTSIARDVHPRHKGLIQAPHGGVFSVSIVGRTLLSAGSDGRVLMFPPQLLRA